MNLNFGTKGFNFLNGHFEWDVWANELIFISHETEKGPEEKIKKTVGPNIQKSVGELNFREDIDLNDKIIFKKFFQRRCKLNEIKCITLQDVKDVVLFTANPKQLTVEILEFLHIPTVDRFLRALIIYFQYYFQIWEKVLIRRKESEIKIYQPIVTTLENILRDNLADLRSMVSREFSSLLIGAKDAYKFHHMANKNHVSLSDKDRRVFELLIKISGRVVWHALHKPSLSIIELEIDRITRTKYFNIFIHQAIKLKSHLETSDGENRILRGISDVEQSKLGAQSPLVKENLKADHDHRMLAIGQVDFPPSDDRLRYLEAAYSVPEEELSKYKIIIGVLGMPRDDFDVMLKQKRKKSKDDTESIPTLVFEFNIPPKIQHSVKTIPNSYPQTLPRIAPESEAKRAQIKAQCKMWISRVESVGKSEDLNDFTISTSGVF